MATDPFAWLEKHTDWDEDGDTLAPNDPSPSEEEEGGVAVLPDEDESGLDDAETVANILSCVGDMNENEQIESIIVIVNTIGDDQLLLTTLERNDLIVGTLETAKLNWFSTQRDCEYMDGEEVDE